MHWFLFGTIFPGTCDAEYIGTDQCAVGINECSSNPCVHGHCVDKRNGFICDCPIYARGVLCDSLSFATGKSFTIDT